VDRSPEATISPHTKNNKYVAKMLLRLKGDKWRKTRANFTPIFTSGKLKAMVPLMHKVADNCVLYLKELCGKNVDGKAFLRNFSLDVIVSTGFGYEVNSYSDPNNLFATNCNMLISTQSKYIKMLSKILEMFSPKLFKFLDLPYFDQNVAEFFIKTISQSIEDRRNSGIKRNDFIDLVQDVMAKEEKRNLLDHNGREELQDLLVSNAFLLFVVGFEMISSSIAILLYYLAKNPDHQEKLFQEISKAVEDFGHYEFEVYGNVFAGKSTFIPYFPS